MSARPTRESDLFPPIRDYLIERGYTVRSEVHDCDIAATKDDALIIVELKRHLSVTLLIQATARQKLTDSVYVAIPRPQAGQWRRQWRGTKRLLRRLELGLLLVSWTRKRARVEVALHPTPIARRKNRRGRRALLEEVAARSGDFNEAGANRRKLVTAYRENALHIACLLDALGAQTPGQLRARDTGPKTLRVLYDNVYGWFDRVGRGVYALNDTGREALETYADVAAPYREDLGKRADA